MPTTARDERHQFPAGVLQPPLYDPKMDDAPNYGDTGGTIGHELTHGFDDQGRKFDAQGNLKDWWTPEDNKNFEARAQCVVDQYAQYVVVDDIKINSKLTEGEDIADLGGLILAWMAWKDRPRTCTWKAATDSPPSSVSSSGTRSGRARMTAPKTCGERHHQSAFARQISRNGLVVNMPEFQKAFSCKAGQPMAKEIAAGSGEPRSRLTAAARFSAPVRRSADRNARSRDGDRSSSLPSGSRALRTRR